MMRLRVDAQRLERVHQLSAHLQRNALGFQGKLDTPPARVHIKLMAPLALLGAALLVLVFSRRARNSLLLKSALLLAGRFLQSEIQAEEARS